MRRQRPKGQLAIHAEAQTPDLKLVAQLAVRVPGQLALRLKRFCRESGRSFNASVAEALEQYLGQKKF